MRGIDQIFTDLDVSLVDQHSCLVDALRLEAFLVDTGLQSLVEEFVEGQTEDVIELEFLVGEETIAMHSVEEGSTFEKSSGVFFLEGEELSGCFSELGEGEMHSPYFSLILEAVLADKLEFVINPFFFVGSSWSLEGCRI